MSLQHIKDIIFNFGNLRRNLERVLLIVVVELLLQQLVAHLVEEEVLSGAALVKVDEVFVILLNSISRFISLFHQVFKLAFFFILLPYRNVFGVTFRLFPYFVNRLCFLQAALAASPR